MHALRKLTWVELKLFAREPFSLIFTVAFPIVLLIVLIGTFKPRDPAFGGHHPSDYYLATYIGVVIGAIGLISLPSTSPPTASEASCAAFAPPRSRSGA
ncbi:MAG: hypothetical protein ACR2IP_12690 [Solirubrobacteraceae bacterium]